MDVLSVVSVGPGLSDENCWIRSWVVRTGPIVGRYRI